MLCLLETDQFEQCSIKSVSAYQREKRITPNSKDRSQKNRQHSEVNERRESAAGLMWVNVQFLHCWAATKKTWVTHVQNLSAVIHKHTVRDLFLCTSRLHFLLLLDFCFEIVAMLQTWLSNSLWPHHPVTDDTVHSLPNQVNPAGSIYTIMHPARAEKWSNSRRWNFNHFKDQFIGFMEGS